MTTREFTTRWVGALALWGLSPLFFALLLGPIIQFSACRGTGGACGALAAVLGILVRGAIVLAVGVYSVQLTRRRVAELNLPRLTSAFVLLMYLAAAPFLFSFGNFWGANFGAGFGLALPTILPLFFLIASLLGLSLYQVQSEADPRTFDPLLATVAFAVAVATAPQWLRGLGMLPFIGWPFLSLSLWLPRIPGMVTPFGLAGPIAWTLSAAFIIVLVKSLAEARRCR